MKNQLLKNQSGFTLMEIMTALCLTMFIFLIVFQLTEISNNTFNTADKRLELAQNARIFFDRLSRELRQTPKITTPLPATKDIQDFPPANEIMFQDGHDVPNIQYLRYFLDTGLLKRQRIIYYFQSEPQIFVQYDAQDAFGNHPTSQITEERTIADYISNLMFYGSQATMIEVWLNKGAISSHFFTGIWGRNTRL